MSAAVNTGTTTATVGRLAEQAAEAVRTLNHLTRPGVGALAEPAEVCELVAALACTTGRLPQLLGQLSGWLVSQQRAGRLRVDTWSPQPNPAAAVAAAAGCLTQAAHSTQRAGHALDAAHQHLAHLATTGNDEQEDRS